jgi:NAD(P)H-dependent flavin oxidoreductase YrpB (nitropropane dioxygenase family)
VAVINSGGFAVLGEAMHTPEEIAADIQWIRDRVDGKPFGIDLVLPASSPPAGSIGDLVAKIPESHRKFAQYIKEKYNVPDPKGPIDLHQWGGLNQEMARSQLDVLLDERVPVIASGLGSPAFILDRAHELGIKVFGLVGKTRQAERQLEAGVDVIIAQGYDAAGHTGAMAPSPSSPRSSPSRATLRSSRRAGRPAGTRPRRCAWEPPECGRAHSGSHPANRMPT